MPDLLVSFVIPTAVILAAVLIGWLASKGWARISPRLHGPDFVIEWHSPGAWKVTRVKAGTGYYLSRIAPYSGPDFGFIRPYVTLVTDADLGKGDWTIVNVENEGPWAFMWVDTERRICRGVRLVEGATGRIEMTGRPMSTKDRPFSAI